jgi:antitoxin HicB
LNEQHIGSSLDEFLEQEGLLEDAMALASKRVVAFQIRQGMHDCRIGPSELARRMGTSRSTVDRLLDMDNPSVTLLTLGRAAAALGKRLDVTLRDAPSSARQLDPSGGPSRLGHCEGLNRASASEPLRWLVWCVRGGADRRVRVGVRPRGSRAHAGGSPVGTYSTPPASAT